MTTSTSRFGDLLPEEKVAVLNADLDRQVRNAGTARARRNANRIGSALCMVASAVSLYDLLLLVRVNH